MQHVSKEYSMPFDMQHLFSEKIRWGDTLATRLRWLREGLGLTLTAFSAQIGYNKSYLSRLESGDSANPTERFIEAVCGKFMIFRDWLTAGKGAPVIPGAIVKA